MATTPMITVASTARRIQTTDRNERFVTGNSIVMFNQERFSWRSSLPSFLSWYEEHECLVLQQSSTIPYFASFGGNEIVVRIDDENCSDLFVIPLCVFARTAS